MEAQEPQLRGHRLWFCSNPRTGGLYHEVTFLRLQSVTTQCDTTARPGLPVSGGSAASLVTLLRAFWSSDSRSAPHPIRRQFYEDWFVCEGVTLHAPVSVLQLFSPRSPARESECGAPRAICMRWSPGWRYPTSLLCTE